MILMGNELGMLGWGMTAHIADSYHPKGNDAPPMVYTYAHELQNEIKYDGKVFFPLAYSDVNASSVNIVWHFNNWDRLKELKVVSAYADNIFDNAELYKVFVKLAKEIKKLTGRKNSKHKERFSLLLMLNNFVSSPELSVFCELENEQFLKLIEIMYRLRNTETVDGPVAASAAEFLMLPDMFLEGILG